LSLGGSGDFAGKMPIDVLGPDVVVSLSPDLYAPRAARYCVANVDRPSPDLRDAVVLLTSELVTRAVQQRRSFSEEALELRVWMPADVVRVELRGPPELIRPSPEPSGPHYDLLIVDRLADRWSIDADEDPACIWFEIDRQPRAEPESKRREHQSLGSA
jgi:hypothetical protein